MTKEDFINAASMIDLEYVEKALDYSEKPVKSKIKTVGSILFKALPIAACFTILIIAAKSGFEHMFPPTSTPEPAVSASASEPPISESTSEPPQTEGFISSKPMLPQSIAVSCRSYYKNGEEIVIDVTMGDEYSRNQIYGRDPSYSSFGVNGCPEFSVCGRELDDHYPSDTINKMIINGELGDFIKRFGFEDMPDLDISGQEYGNNSDGHHETVEIDFSQLKPGDCGSIVFCFGWLFPSDDLDEPPEFDNSAVGTTLGYYVGDNGIAFGGSWEEAKENLENEKNIDIHNEVWGGHIRDTQACY